VSLPRTRPELEAAGFNLRAANVKCPCCSGTVDIWQQSGKMPVFLDPYTFERHLIVIHVPEKKKEGFAQSGFVFAAGQEDGRSGA
jgi:hypothetical protein